MNLFLSTLFFLSLFTSPMMGDTQLKVGTAKTDITPPIGTPSAGYAERKGVGMEGVHDPLLAIALFIDNGEKQLVFCSVDHLGFTYDMVQKITKKVHSYSELQQCEVFIGSSHTHSGGGSYLNIPVLGELLAGTYDPSITDFYINKTCEAILQAYKQKTPAKIGISYGEAPPLTQYRSSWPENVSPLSSVTLLKVVHLDGSPLALLFNYPVHPTVLKNQNRLFSADLVGYTRDHLQRAIGHEVQPIYFNGAQGDIVPIIFNEEDRFDSCNQFAFHLATAVKTIWDTTETKDTLDIKIQKESYAFKPQPNPFGTTLPIGLYQTELNLIVLNHFYAFMTIPGELSCLYDKLFQNIGCALGFSHVSILGLTNDAHGYIILPTSWQHKTFESRLSFGGEFYGETVKEKGEALLKENAPKGTFIHE